MRNQYIRIVILLLCGAILTAPASVLARIHDDGPYSSVSIRFKMKKVNFKIGEEVTGKIILENDYPANVPAVFKVRLYHDGYFVSEVLTSVKTVPMGRTDFTFKGFGVPGFNDTRASVGRWDIKIVQQHMDERFAKMATVRIVAEEMNKEKKR